MSWRKGAFSVGERWATQRVPGTGGPRGCTAWSTASSPGWQAWVSLRPTRFAWRSSVAEPEGPFAFAVTTATRNGEHYLVSLAGESDWVRNLRAAGGKAVVRHGRRTKVWTQELPAIERAPILQAYLSKRALSKSAAAAAHHYFGLEAHPSLEALAMIASHYPVFNVNSIR